MTDFEIKYLADCPQHFKACAAWLYGRWGVQAGSGSLERAFEIFQNGSQKDNLPLTLVVINTETNLPVAMGSLWEKDGPEWPNKTPWIASIYTLENYRGLGLAKQVVERLEQEAQRLGFSEIYLHSSSAVDLYKKIGYTELDIVKTQRTVEKTKTLFIKNFNN